MNEFNLKSIFSFNPDDIEIKDFGIKINTDYVDYATLKCSPKISFWYDADDCIQLIDYNVYQKYIINYDLKSNNVSVVSYIFNSVGMINKKERHEFPFDEYTEESFFMMSTLHDVGEFDFNSYNVFKNSVLKIKAIIKAIEESQ